MLVERHPHCTLFVATALLAVVFSTGVNAGGLAIREQSASGQGMSFAGEGTSSMGLSAMFWNPAAVTQAQGFWSESHGALFFPHSTLSAEAGTSPALLAFGADSGNIGQFAIIPSSYFAYRVNPNLYLGLAINAPFGSATEPDGIWAGSVYAHVAKVKSIDVNPIIGWKFNDQWSVAFGPRIAYAYGGRFTRYLGPTPGDVAEVRGLDDIGFGFSAGITYTPSPFTEFALGYRSRLKLTLEGQQNIPSLGINDASASGDVTVPDQINFGVRHRITDRFTLLGTVEWTNWSVLDNVPIDAPVPTTLTFNYRDGWFFSIGGEYQWTPQTTLRAGIAYEISPVEGQVRDTFLPDDDRWWFSAGLTHQVNERWTVDLGYSFVWLGDSSVNIVPGHPDFPTVGLPLVASAETHNHILSAALRYKWTLDAPPPGKIIRK